MTIARFLKEQPLVKEVFYPGLDSHSNHDVAVEQMSGFGGVLSFTMQGGVDAARHFLPQLQVAHLAANLGSVETVAGPPRTTSHVECTPEQRKALGIPEGMIRYSEGIEETSDLMEDIQQALIYTSQKLKLLVY